MFGGRALSRSAVIGKAGSLRPATSFVSARSLSHIAARSLPTVGRGGRVRLEANSSWKPASISGYSFARFNSTSPGNASSGSENVTPVTENGANDLDGLLTDISDIPERLGYLKELGLDYGWGPSSIMEWTIEHIHILSGLPWWASIVAAGVLVRLALFKPSLSAADNAARTAPIKDKLTALKTERLLYISQGKQLEAARIKEQQEELYKSAGVNLWKGFLPLLQVPFGFGCFRVVRGMTTLPVPALTIEEFGWVHDLTSYDPLFVLPIATTAFMYYSLKKGTENGLNEMGNSSLGRGILVGLPLLSLAFIAWQPAALQLYFAATGLFGLIQAYLINSPTARSWLGIAPLPSRDGSSFHTLEKRQAQLRMIRENIEAVRAQLNSPAEVPGSAVKAENVSVLDKMINNTKQEFSNMKNEMNEKIESFRGIKSTTPDGAPAPKPRLTEEEKREAERYRLVREAEDQLLRKQRNDARMSSHKNRMDHARAQAPRTWQEMRAAQKKAENKAKAKSKN